MKVESHRLGAAFKPPRFRLAQLLEREANNLDLIRLICACLVIYGHAFALTPDPAYPSAIWDPSTRLGYAGVYSASIAVKIFFFISGLVVTNSLLVKRSVSQYVIGRLFRIWPALAVVVFAAAFLVGPWLTDLDLREYFSRLSVYHYVAGNVLMLMPGNLPGVFSDNPLPSLVNGALWTLPFEIAAYFAILLLAVLGVFRSRILCGIILLLIIADPLLPHPLIFRWLGSNPQYIYLPPCFAFGAFLALFKNHIVVSLKTTLASVTLFWLLRRTAFGPMVFFFSLFISLLYVSGLPWMRRIRLKSDLSYGTFLWGFLIQQIVAEKFPDRGLLWNFGVSLAIALIIGFLSWKFIEQPSIRFGRRLANRWTGEHSTDSIPDAPPSIVMP